MAPTSAHPGRTARWLLLTTRHLAQVVVNPLPKSAFGGQDDSYIVLNRPWAFVEWCATGRYLAASVLRPARWLPPTLSEDGAALSGGGG